MKRYAAFVTAAALGLLVLGSTSLGGRGGRGGGGGGGGGGRGGGAGGGGGARPAGGGGGVVNSYGGGGAGGARPSAPVVGPSGGHVGGGNMPGGAQGSRPVGGVQGGAAGTRDVARPGGPGPGGPVAGQGGNLGGGNAGAIAGGAGQGSLGAKYQGGVAIGPQGGAAAKVGGGANGAIAGGERGGVASGPYGSVAGRTAVAAGGSGTYYRSAAAIRGQGALVRQGVANYPCFRPGWYTDHPGAWMAAGWAANTVWRAATWDSYAGYSGAAADPIYYDYGENVVYQDDGVYFNGEKAYSTEDYVQSAAVLANNGATAKATKEEEWLPLGVFAMVQGEEKTSNNIFQLAVNKEGAIRGNYYEALTDATSTVVGSVDKATQRAAWTVGDRKTPIYETGIANLTKSESTMLVHYSKDRSQQYSLIRIEEPEKTEATK